LEVNVANQRDPKTGSCLGTGNGNTSAGFKKGQNQKRQANEMQGTRSRAHMDRETWNALGDLDEKAWDGLSDQAKTKVTACHFNKGKEHASQDSEVNNMEAKEHDLVFDDSEDEMEAKQHDLEFDDDSDGEPEGQVEVSKHEAVKASDAESARKMHEGEGVDFDAILQAQKAAARLQVRQHDLHDQDSSDDESTVPDLEANAHDQCDSDDDSCICCGLEVNAHNLKSKGETLPKIDGLAEFLDSEEEG